MTSTEVPPSTAGNPTPADLAADPAAAGSVVLLDRSQGAELHALDQWAFAFDDGDLDPEPVLDSLPWGRVFGIRDGAGRLIACGAAHSLSLPVPGGVAVPAAGLTWIGVHPQERRRGRLTALIRHHLNDVHERREPVSVLWAAEPGIYGRFGYGVASRQVALTLSRGLALRAVPGADEVEIRIEKADQDRHAELVASCYDAARVTVPGWVSRPGRHLQRLALEDQAFMRRGAETLRLMTAWGAAGELRGYALFRRKSAWTQDGLPDGTVRVRECVATDPAASRALWGRLTDLDLMARVETDDRPIDDVLVQLAVDLRSVTTRLGDGIWLRLVDLPGALTGRRYATDVDVVLAVTDRHCPWNAGRWRLAAGPTGATCRPTTDAADLTLDVADLASAYLGGSTLTALARAGLVTARSDSVLAAASTAFASPTAPYCPWTF